MHAPVQPWSVTSTDKAGTAPPPPNPDLREERGWISFTNITSDASIKVVKEASVIDDGDNVRGAGDIIKYTITVTIIIHLHLNNILIGEEKEEEELNEGGGAD